MNTAYKLARIIGALAACAVLCGCSAVKLGYSNLDEAAYWWLDGYIDFTDSQAVRVREDLDRLHLWHRGTELPRYAQLLQKMERLAPGDVTPAQACELVDSVRERVTVVANQAEPAVVALALSLEAAQLAHLERKYQRNNAEYRKDWVRLPPAGQADKRFDQLLDRSEMVYGRLDEPQRAVLRQQLERSVFDARRNLAERERRQADALQTLRKLAGTPIGVAEARALMRAYLDRVQESPDAAYRKYQAELIQEGCRIFAVTHNSTTPAQRDAAVRRLRAYQRDLGELAAQR